MFQLSKKGFTLVEVICSLSIFSIIFICMVSFEASSLNMKRDVKYINNNVLVMETLKNSIIYSMTFIELEQLIKDNKIYITNENMDFDKIKTDVMDVFTMPIPTQKPYIGLSYLKDNLKVYKLTLSLYTEESSDIGEIQCNFYKGDHE